MRRQDELLPIHHTIAGSTSGILARIIGQPLDVLKIRFQLQNKTLTCDRKYKTVSSATLLIVQEEGIKALWKGHVPAQLLSVVFGAVQFTVYPQAKKFLLAHINQSEGSLVHAGADFLSGGVAGISASIACQPLDVIRTRFVAQSKIKVYNGMIDATKKMYLEQGFKTFYKGFTPTLALIFPYAGLHFLFYNTFKKAWDYVFCGNENQKMKRLFCGGLSGLSAKVILLPLDFVKKCLQVQGFHGNVAPKYTNMMQCIDVSVRDYGWKVLYSGTSPSILKACVTTAVTFFVYEETCDLIRAYRKENVF